MIINLPFNITFLTIINICRNTGKYILRLIRFVCLCLYIAKLKKDIDERGELIDEERKE